MPSRLIADHAAGEVAPHVGVVREHAALDAVEIGVVEAERVGAGDEHRAVGREHDATLDVRLDQDVEVLEPAVVRRKLRAPDGLLTEVQHASLRERLVPDLVVEVLDRPFLCGFALRRCEVGEVDVAVLGELRVEHDVVEALRRSDLHRRHAGDRVRHFAVGRDRAQVAAPLLTRKLPSGRNAIAHGPMSLSVIVSVRYFDFCFGGGASVWPAKAGFGCGWSASVLGAVASDETTSSEAASCVVRTIGVAWVRAPFEVP